LVEVVVSLLVLTKLSVDAVELVVEHLVFVGADALGLGAEGLEEGELLLDGMLGLNVNSNSLDG